MRTGLLPLSQEAIILGEVAYYTPTKPVTADSAGDNTEVDGTDGITTGGCLSATDLSAERAAVSKVLRTDTHVLFVRCRGLLALGETIEEAWHYATNALVACETQVNITLVLIGICSWNRSFFNDSIIAVLR